MIFRDAKRLSLLIAPIIILFYLTYTVYKPAFTLSKDATSFTQEGNLPQQHQTENQQQEDHSSDEEDSDADILKGIPIFPNGPEIDIPPSSGDEKDTGIVLGHVEEESAAPDTHKELFSPSTVNKQFFYIDMGSIGTYNPNIIPHPTQSDRWIVVAALVNNEGGSDSFEVECTASFKDQALRCDDAAKVLPVKQEVADNCVDDFSYLNLNNGPHDARVFMGPQSPFIIYGSNSRFVCFGQFVQSLQYLGEWDSKPKPPLFEAGTEMQRPEPWGGQLQKNWFLFWDAEGNMYAHYDVYPKRVFSQMYSNGRSGPDLATIPAESDDKCIAKYFPKLAPEHESIHQSTNSLVITMCRRNDDSCVRSDDNTFIFTIFQHKTFHSLHAAYEPYVMVFNQRAPFAIHGISKRPLWIHGRKARPERNTSDMFYVTSINWKNQNQNNHGYLDDVLFLAFGIEDEMSGAIDVVANDLFGELGSCYGL